MSFTAHGETESYFRGSEVLLLCEALTHSIEHPALFQTPDIRLMSQMQNCHPVSEENLNRTWLMTVDKYSSVLNRFLGSSFWTCTFHCSKFIDLAGHEFSFQIFPGRQLTIILLWAAEIISDLLVESRPGKLQYTEAWQCKIMGILLFRGLKEPIENSLWVQIIIIITKLNWLHK